jgi:high-affinity nickel-transport protein
MAIIVFNITVTPSIGLTMELAVALMLMGLGIFRVVRAVRERGDAPPPAPRATHGLRGVLETVGRAQAARSVGIGLVHGLAGSAAVALLVLSTVRSPYAALAYLALFGLGTIVGMTAITALLSLPFTAPLPALNRVLALGTGVLSFGLGLYLTVQIGFVDGLLLGHPVWTPR